MASAAAVSSAPSAMILIREPKLAARVMMPMIDLALILLPAFSRKILLAARPRPSGRIVDSPGQRGREMSLVGKWRITQMDVWSQDEFDLVGPGFPRKRGRG